jgi:hypothetical protein
LVIVKLSNVSTLARCLLHEHHDLDCCLEQLGAAREGEGRRGLRRLLRGVLDMPLAAANAGDAAHRF